VVPWTDGQRAPNGRDTINGQAMLTLCPLPIANGRRATNGHATRINGQATRTRGQRAKSQPAGGQACVAM